MRFLILLSDLHLEEEMLDSRYEDGGKDVSVINAAITAGRAYWKS